MSLDHFWTDSHDMFVLIFIGVTDTQSTSIQKVIINEWHSKDMR